MLHFAKQGDYAFAEFRDFFCRKKLEKERERCRKSWINKEKDRKRRKKET